MINMFWEDCSEPSFYKHICQPESFWYLNGKNVIYPRVAEIVINYIEADENNFNKLTRKLIKNQKIFQYVYISVYPEVYSFIEKIGVDMRNNFHLKFKEWKDRKIYSQKLIEGYFSKPQNSPSPEDVINEDFEEEKKIAEKQERKEMEEKNKKKENVDAKLRQKTTNLKELRRQKRKKGTRKKCGQGSKN